MLIAHIFDLMFIKLPVFWAAFSQVLIGNLDTQASSFMAIVL